MAKQWSDEQIEDLTARLVNLETYREIAAATGRSRSAVGAFIMRNPEIQAAAAGRRCRSSPRPRLPRGMLFNKNPTGPAIKYAGKPPKPGKPNGAPKPPAPEPKPMPPPPTPEPPRPAARTDLIEPESLGLTLPELTSMQCHWPGKYDPDVEGKFLFCGHPVAAPGRPYCPYHDRIAMPNRVSRMDGWAEEAVI